MAKVKQTITKTRTRKTESGYIKCNMCHGTGKVKNGHKKK